MIYLAYFFFGLAAFFALFGALGTLFMPDVYTRLQASGLSATTSVVSVLLGSMFWADFGPMTGRLLVIFLFFLISSPTTSHIVGRYAWREGMIPWRRPVRWGTLSVDRKEDEDD